MVGRTKRIIQQHRQRGRDTDRQTEDKI